MKRLLRRVAELVAPAYTQRRLEARWLEQHAHEFSAEIRQQPSIEGRVDYARQHAHLRSNQKRAEIIGLLKLLDGMRPRLLCEIGADRGGTLALLGSVAAPDARILSLDIEYPESRAQVYRILAQPGQQLTCVEANSHATETLERVKQWLGGERLDFLFIDGDHSYAGVKADYDMYGPLVRSGGVIAFHDIVKDFRTRFGTVTPRDAGEVPRYWTELRSSVPGYEELIEDPEQDGYGIGVVHVP
jgi:predicted O-methyltransferase YrrM